jgi:hypothetical protein
MRLTKIIQEWIKENFSNFDLCFEDFKTFADIRYEDHLIVTISDNYVAVRTHVDTDNHRNNEDYHFFQHINIDDPKSLEILKDLMLKVIIEINIGNF